MQEVNGLVGVPPYGASTTADDDGLRQLSENELAGGRYPGDT